MIYHSWISLINQFRVRYRAPAISDCVILINGYRLAERAFF